MDKSIKIILYILIGIVIIHFSVSMFGNSNLKSIRKDLEKAKLSADSALTELKFSKSKLDSIMADIVVFRAYISSIQKTVALDDAEKRLREEKDSKKASEIKNSITELKEALKHDSLPPIEELPIKKSS